MAHKTKTQCSVPSMCIPEFGARCSPSSLPHVASHSVAPHKNAQNKMKNQTPNQRHTKRQTIKHQN